MQNPIVVGKISPGLGLVIVVASPSMSALFSLIVNPLILILWTCVLLAVLGLALGYLEKPLLRAMSLGALQSFYVFIGSFSAENTRWAAIFLALFLFSAMTGGKVIGDVRDLAHDTRTDTKTIPREYGLSYTRIFLLLHEMLAYLFGLMAYWIGGLSRGFLYSMLGIITGGTVINLIFVRKATPEITDLTNKLSLGLLGMLSVLGMIFVRTE